MRPEMAASYKIRRRLPMSASAIDGEAAELLGRLAGLAAIALDTATLPWPIEIAMREAVADYRRWLGLPPGREAA
jgi:hypothetical protein